MSGEADHPAARRRLFATAAIGLVDMAERWGLNRLPEFRVFYREAAVCHYPEGLAWRRGTCRESFPLSERIKKF